MIAFLNEEIVRFFHEEAVVSSSGGLNVAADLSLGLSNNFSLDDNYSDEEDLDGGVDAAPPTGQTVTAPRTSQSFEQLYNQFLAARAGNFTPGTSRGMFQLPSGPITPEMLRQAIHHTSQPSTSSASGPSLSAPSASISDSGDPGRDWSKQLQQMHEFGISDDAICIQALEATNGDVQAAINLVFSEHFN